MTPARAFGWREVTLLALAAIPLAVLMLGAEPIPQDPSYHALADTRTCARHPELRQRRVERRISDRRRARTASVPDAGRLGCVAFVAGFLHRRCGDLGRLGAYYHWAPDDATLAWDRLPMTIVFMALFAALTSEHVRLHLEHVLLPVALVLGAASVAWWRYADDLRFYAWVQFAPLVMIAFLLLAYRGRYTHREYLAYGLVAYALAKATELGDAAIFEWTGRMISGHTLKHLLAALALFAVYLMLRKRRRVA